MSKGVAVMKKTLTLLAIAICAIGIGVSAAAASSHKTGGVPVTVAMHDPGCHWFLVSGKYKKSLTIAGPVSLLNVDEATLKVRSRSGMKLDRVGHKLQLTRGTYHITMVGQAPDDNHLILTVR